MRAAARFNMKIVGSIWRLFSKPAFRHLRTSTQKNGLSVRSHFLMEKLYFQPSMQIKCYPRFWMRLRFSPLHARARHMVQRHAFDLYQTLFVRWIPNYNVPLKTLLRHFRTCNTGLQYYSKPRHANFTQRIFRTNLKSFIYAFSLLLTDFLNQYCACRWEINFRISKKLRVMLRRSSCEAIFCQLPYLSKTDRPERAGQTRRYITRLIP